MPSVNMSAFLTHPWQVETAFETGAFETCVYIAAIGNQLGFARPRVTQKNDLHWTLNPETI